MEKTVTINLQTQELRTGNFLTDNNGKYIKVNWETIKKLSESLSEQEFGWFGIPLSKEWLENIGFEFTSKALFSKYDAYVKDNIYCVNDIYQFSIRTLQPWIGEDYWNDTCISTIEYVHQLQNLYFSITGNELNIKL